ncbi:hypothetical protein ACS386_01440 [Flavobacteriaceae bacterium LMO-SS05]|jgi:hypothetical protein
MYKILKIVAAALGLIGIIFLIRIIAVGDEAIKAGDDGAVDPIAYVAYIILGLTLAFVLYFVLKNLFTNTGSLKNTLIGAGAFVAVLVIAYALSGGDTTVYKYNGLAASDGASQMVGAGLVSFYILMVAALAAMVLSGIKKMIK